MNTLKPCASLVSGALLVTALGLLSGCSDTGTSALTAGNPPRGYSTVSTRSVRSGTTIHVALGGDVSSRTAKVGDAWFGTVTENVMNQDENVIPPGSRVDGVVTGVLPAQSGSRAMLALGISGIRVDGHDEAIVASSEPVIAGSSRARNLGAIAGGAAAGAPNGQDAGDGRYAVVGGLIGSAGVGGVVAAFDGYQVVLSDGTVVSFTVSQTVAMR